jgi:ABC-2 type transport system permease protein
MSLLMPVIYLMILGNSFQGKLQALPLAVVSADAGPYARSLLENLRAVEAGPRTLIIVNAQDEKAAMDGVRNGIFKAALVIPADFSKRITVKKRPEVGLFLDNTDGISAETIKNTVHGAIAAIGSDYVSIRERADEIFLRDTNLYRKVDYYQSLVPGVVVMAVFLGALTTGVFNIVMDRFLGIEESYLLTPLTKADIVGGLVISGLSITTIVAVLVLAVSMTLTGIPLPSSVTQLASVLAVIVLTTLCLLSLMFAFLGRASNPRIVGILSGFLNVILFFPSGAIYPIASLPEWLKAFAKINPEAYAVAALKAILFKGANLMSILGDVTFLLIFTAVMMTTAIALFKRRL